MTPSEAIAEMRSFLPLENSQRVIESSRLQSWLAALTPPAVEPVEQAGRKWFDVAAYNSLANAIIPILEADGVHSQLLLHSAMKIADLCQSAVTAATAELQAERDAAAKELQHIAIHHIGTTYPVPANEPPLYIQNRQRMGEYEDRERELTAKVERLERTTFALASDLGRSEGKLLASEMVGVVDGWKARAEAAESQITALQSQLAATREELGNHQIDRGGVLEAIGLPADAEVALAQAVREWVAAQARTTVENVDGGAQ